MDHSSGCESILDNYNKCASFFRECEPALERYKKADSVIKKCEKMLEFVEKYSKYKPAIRRRDDSRWIPDDFFETDIEGGYSGFFENYQRTAGLLNF